MLVSAFKPRKVAQTMWRAPLRSGRGFSLIEVLVTIVIIVFGLLGVVGLQARAARVEFESYQRGQALALAREMESRIAASRGVIDEFLDDAVSSTDGSVYFGVDGSADCGAPATIAQRQGCTWGTELRGAAATEGGNAVGAMIGARGCLIRLEPPQANALADLFIVVVWQGLVPGAEPPADSPAGSANCAGDVNYGDGLRRGISLRVLVPRLRAL